MSTFSYAAYTLDGRHVDGQIEAWKANAGRLRRRPRRASAIPPPPISATIGAALRQDVRYTFRVIARQPGYAAVLIATL